MSKQEMRARLAALSFSEKIKILEKLRQRSLTIAASSLRRRESSKAPSQAGKVASPPDRGT